VIAPGLAATDGSASEGTPTLETPVELYGSIDHVVTVDYATGDGTALAGEDYSSATGTLTFAPGQATKSVSVPLVSDRLTEPNESFSLTLSNVRYGTSQASAPTGGPPVTLVSPETTGTILDNDPK
jgi:hypothetical protein